MAKKKLKCPFCEKIYVNKLGLYTHMETKHSESLGGLSAAQVFFNYRNHYQLTRGNGRSVISGKPTPWNPVTERYARFANEEEKKEFREMFKKRMLHVHGKITLLDDPEYQANVMLPARSISGEYTWEDGSKTKYVGSFERNFLEHLADTFDWDSGADIAGPCPILIDYQFNGQTYQHIPDFYITSLNLIINIKSRNNKGYRLQNIDREIAEDKAIEQTKYNYIKIYENEFDDFDDFISLVKEEGIENVKRICKY